MPKTIFLWGIGVALVAGAFAATDALLGPRPGVTEANIKRVHPGMTTTEVLAILGEPHGLPDCQADHQTWFWQDGGARAGVDFRNKGRVIRAWFCSENPPRPGLLARLRSWAGW